MRVSRALIPTVKEPPSDATNVSHILLTRAGFIRRVGAGIYDFLPLGLRVLRKVEAIIREELDREGALEILMPALLPAEYFKETGRYEGFGDTLFRLKDRKSAEYHLAPTHEEIATDIARREIHSWRDMPKIIYQIQTKFRDEPRPRGGLLRCREFIMKDAYSFDVSEEAAAVSYEKMRQTYCRIFDRLGLDYRIVQADSGAMGGSTSAEFQILAESGEDAIVACDQCDYAANIEVASVRADEPGAAPPPRSVEKVKTTGAGSIEAVAKFLKTEPKAMLKSLVYVANKQTVLVVVRGDHEVNEIRLARLLGATEVALASDTEVRRSTNAAVGYAGPVGFSGKILVDRSAAAVHHGVAGANETDYHIVGVEFGRDYQGDVVDVRLATAGDTCPSCGKGKFSLYKGIEGGHIFIQGAFYSAKMRANFLDESQKTHPVIGGAYGIGVSRLLASTVEQNHDADGIRWPVSIAPYAVHIVSLSNDEAVTQAARTLYETLWAAGVEVLWDERDERPGVKFKDADLIGLPLRVTVGGKSLAAGNIELRVRREAAPGKKDELVPVANAATRVQEALKTLQAAKPPRSGGALSV